MIPSEHKSMKRLFLPSSHVDQSNLQRQDLIQHKIKPEYVRATHYISHCGYITCMGCAFDTASEATIAHSVHNYTLTFSG